MAQNPRRKMPSTLILPVLTNGLKTKANRVTMIATDQKIVLALCTQSIHAGTGVTPAGTRFISPLAYHCQKIQSCSAQQNTPPPAHHHSAKLFRSMAASVLVVN